MFFWKRMCASFLAVTLVLPVSVSAASGIRGSPKILNLYLGWEIKESDVPLLARWDMLVLDVDQQQRYPHLIRQLRERNPKIIILAYISSSEIAQARFLESTDFPMGRLAKDVQDAWYLRAPNGNRTEFWPGSSLLNVTNLSSGTGERWNEYLPRFIRDQVMSTGLWDGIFLDNTFVGISYFARSQVDLDRNGRAETDVDANTKWQAGTRSLIHAIRALNPNALLIGNGGTVYADQLNGILSENFPSWNWNENLREYRDALTKNRGPKLGSINVNTKNEARPQDFKRMRFGLASTLMDDGYYSFDQGDWNHHVMWWYDEYEANLGMPQGAAKKIIEQPTTAEGSVWLRRFTKGIAVVNGTNVARRINLPGVFERLRGKQDPQTNDGSLIRTLNLDAQDGAILFNRSDVSDIKNTSFQNGSFVRIFNGQGQVVQNGFFAQREDAPSGALVFIGNVDSEEREDQIYMNGDTVTVKPGKGGKVINFKPFGKSKQTFTLSVGNVNRDPQKEIIVARNGGGPSEVRVFNMKGKLLVSWVAYNPAFLGGVRTAVGDVDGDGLREIVTAPGPGGGPHIKIWKTDGKNWGGSFFAFDPGEVGGVSIAIGDVDGDGKAEIIAGSGQGSIPRVRIFDFRGTLKQEFRIGNVPLAQGITVGTTDIQGDGKDEIFITGQSAF
ncbi:VCBS repeat-containing protein [Candidatus Uhrbacteria bacterium]|nr:VCBS repeat-containing protein [Candidatus Uhrbacteria bacterium]